MTQFTLYYLNPVKIVVVEIADLKILTKREIPPPGLSHHQCDQMA